MVHIRSPRQERSILGLYIRKAVHQSACRGWYTSVSLVRSVPSLGRTSGELNISYSRMVHIRPDRDRTSGGLYNQLVRDVFRLYHHSSVVHLVGCIPCLGAWRLIGCAGGIVGAMHYTAYGGCVTDSEIYATIFVSSLT